MDIVDWFATRYLRKKQIYNTWGICVWRFWWSCRRIGWRSSCNNKVYRLIGGDVINYSLFLAFQYQFLPLQRLRGGVWTLQAPGRAKAWVWLTLIPSDEPPPLRTSHKHCGDDRTTLASCVQHPEDGVEEFPVM